jgi:hypothetical protein
MDTCKKAHAQVHTHEYCMYACMYMHVNTHVFKRDRVCTYIHFLLPNRILGASTLKEKHQREAENLRQIHVPRHLGQIFLSREQQDSRQACGVRVVWETSCRETRIYLHKKASKLQRRNKQKFECMTSRTRDFVVSRSRLCAHYSSTS